MDPQSWKMSEDVGRMFEACCHGTGTACNCECRKCKQRAHIFVQSFWSCSQGSIQSTMLTFDECAHDFHHSWAAVAVARTLLGINGIQEGYTILHLLVPAKRSIVDLKRFALQYQVACRGRGSHSRPIRLWK